jgi:hypothetical protein
VGKEISILIEPVQIKFHLLSTNKVDEIEQKRAKMPKISSITH